MSLKSVVELYRELEGPIYNEENRTFSCSCNYTDKIKNLLENIDLDYVNIKSIYINGQFFEIESLPSTNNDNSITLKITVSTSSPISFFENIESFLKRAANTIANCRLPEEFFIVNDDYYSGDEVVLTKIENLKNLFKLIDCLSKVAEHKKIDKNEQSLIFFSKIDGTVITLPLKIELKNVSLLDCDVQLQLFSDLCSDDKDDLLINEKRTVFKETLFDFLKDKSEYFNYLVSNFDAFKDKFITNLKLYLSRFSFQKIRQDVANAEIDFSTKCSKTLSDIQSKLFGIPVSFAGVIVLLKAKEPLEIFLLFIGLFIMSLILFSTVKVQLGNFANIEIACKDIFDGFTNRYNSYPEELQKVIKNEWDALTKQQDNVQCWLRFFLILSWCPFVVAITLYYIDPILSFLNYVFSIDCMGQILKRWPNLVFHQM